MAKRTAARKPRAKASKRGASKASKPAAGKAAGVSLHVGLNSVDPAQYSGWSGPLKACEADAHDMAALAAAQQIASTSLLTANATRANTLTAIRKAATQLKAGDLFFLSYSGHGGQVDDVSGEEDDKLDETWCLYDGQLIDDELYLELSKFKKGVRILVLSDSCHSGTVTRARPTPPPPDFRPKLMPPEIAEKVYKDHKAFYDGLQRNVMKASKSAPLIDPDAALAQVTVSGRLSSVAARCRASVLLISGCQDNQTSLDGLKNGAFTEQLLKTWNKGAFTGNYTQLHAKIRGAMPPTQTPNLFQLGPAAAFAKQHPFKV
jgi:hypothetical protein